MAMTDYLENELLDHICGVGAWTAPGTLYLALLKSASADDDDTTSDATKEVETPGQNGYSRQSITFGSAASGGSISNTAQITFGAATSDWAEATHAWIVDNSAASTGDILLHGALAVSKDAGVDDTIVFAIGDITFTLS